MPTKEGFISRLLKKLLNVKCLQCYDTGKIYNPGTMRVCDCKLEDMVLQNREDIKKLKEMWSKK